MGSLWHQTAQMEARPPLEGDVEVEVVVIGGGLTGVLTAYMLKQMGKSALILEADRVGGGTTGGSTGKITAQHGLIYATLIETFGKASARGYAKANLNALQKFKEIIQNEGIDCGFQTANSYVYSTRGTKTLKAEAEAMRRLDMDADFIVEPRELAFEVSGAVRLKEQAYFHPLRFLYGVAKGLDIREQTRVTNVENDVVYTPRGRVKAKDVVFACRYPIINIPGYYFLRMSQQRSYLMALENAAKLEHMYVDENDNGLTLRPYENMLLFGGFDLRSGKNTTGGKYKSLLSKARELYPEAELKAQWSAEDCRPADNIPYIGRYSESTPNWHVATGYNKWGITSAMAAAEQLANGIVNGREALSVFFPGRFEVAASAVNLAGDVKETVAGLAKGLFSIPDEALSGIGRGEAKLVDHENTRVCAYRDESGKAHVIPSRCSHLGCRLEWNADDTAWECPCHGSRFTVDGAILDGPTVKPMEWEE